MYKCVNTPCPGALSCAEVDKEVLEVKNCAMGIQFIEDKLFGGMKIEEVTVF
jgi:hypothetical protein